MKSSNQIRETFLEFFEERSHKRVKSGSLVPKNDPTLLFTNAGMNQFKDVFLGAEQREYRRAVSSQKCMRVSGKHNDLETVGRTARHHTFFEMLGNFSFGDYFKSDAIRFAWDLCTRVYGVDEHRLTVTVFEEDDEAYGIWRDEVGVPADRIFRCGEKDNFWAMGETGPCGPCSELHYDMGDRIGDTTSRFEDESERFIEIWNLVFMQFNRDRSGRLNPLPSPSIDTGMGLERIASVIQGVASNYDTDLFRPLIEEASRLTGVAYGKSEATDVSLRILADHSRACTFLIDDGVLPANEGRGYVLRKILRRAIRHGKMLGKEEPFVFTLSGLVAELMHEPYPELQKSREYAARIVKNEEEKFSLTLSHGINRLEEIISRLGEHDRTLPGAELFRLYDTYGFPLDLAREIADERGYSIDEEGFRAELEKQRIRARASWKGGEQVVSPLHRELAGRDLVTDFAGYDSLVDVEAFVLAILRDGEETSLLTEGQTGEIVLDRSPFYAEAGGQVTDQGVIEGANLQAEVEFVHVPVSGLRLHRVRVLHGELRTGDKVSASVLVDRRLRTASNHTATHLLHAALRDVLGEHVKQAGSLVAPDRLRFDFTHYRPLSSWEIREIEKQVNEKIRENIALRTQIRSLDEAVESGAMALFGEKYAERVRVVEVPGYSLELCGGTHVKRTGDISLFKLISESSISSGVRRIEAVTGPEALSRFFHDEDVIHQLAVETRSSREELGSTVQRLLTELKDSRKQVEKLQLELAHRDTGDVLALSREIRGVRVLARKVDNVDRASLRQLADEMKNRLKSGVVVLATPDGGKVSVVAMVSSDLTDRITATDLIKRIAPLVGGGGGGKPDMAEAGGKNPANLERALSETYRFVDEILGKP